MSPFPENDELPSFESTQAKAKDGVLESKMTSLTLNSFLQKGVSSRNACIRNWIPRGFLPTEDVEARVLSFIDLEDLSIQAGAFLNSTFMIDMRAVSPPLIRQLAEKVSTLLRQKKIQSTPRALFLGQGRLDEFPAKGDLSLWAENMKAISAFTTRLSPRALREIVESCTSLVSLTLTSVLRINDDSVAGIGKGLPKLQTLRLVKLLTSDNAVSEAISGHAQTLRRLSLRGCKSIKQKSADAWPSSLEMLDISQCDHIPPSALLRNLPRCTKLKHLMINNDAIRDGHLTALAATCHRITNLDVSGPNVTGNGVSILLEANKKQLSELKIQGGGLCDLSNLKSLKKLTLSHFDGDSLCVAASSIAPQLTALSLTKSQTPATANGVSAFLERCVSLTELSLVDCAHDELLTAMKASGETLTKLVLHGPYTPSKLSDALRELSAPLTTLDVALEDEWSPNLENTHYPFCLQVLRMKPIADTSGWSFLTDYPWPKLTSLALRFTKTSAIKALPLLPSLPALTDLTLPLLTDLKEDDIYNRLASAAPKIERLSITGASHLLSLGRIGVFKRLLTLILRDCGLTDKGLLEIGYQCPGLYALQIWNSRNLSIESRVEFQRQRPHIDYM